MMDTVHGYYRSKTTGNRLALVRVVEDWFEEGWIEVETTLGDRFETTIDTLNMYYEFVDAPFEREMDNGFL